MGEAHMGMQARLMSQALRKLTGSISKTKTTVMFINQLREKVGVIFGCFSYTTRVTLADGSQQKIGTIVNQRRPVDVLTADLATGAVESRRVTNWFNNGATDDFLAVTVYKPSGNGRAQFSATPNHEILTAEGFAPLRELGPGDQVMLVQLFRLSPWQLDVIRGSLLGDGNLSAWKKRNQSRGVRFRLGHGPKQKEYLDWKTSLFKNVPGCYRTNSEGAVNWDSTPLPELWDTYANVYRGGRKHFSHEYLESLSPLAIALWYQDDAGFTLRGKRQDRGRVSICVEAMDEETRERLVESLWWRFGVQGRLTVVRGMAILKFEQPATDRLHAVIAPYVHPSMEYKLLPQYRGRFAVQPEFVEPERRLVPSAIASIRPKPPTGNGRRR